jgi:predicted HTH domain antitoxin
VAAVGWCRRHVWGIKVLVLVFHLGIVFFGGAVELLAVAVR